MQLIADIFRIKYSLDITMIFFGHFDIAFKTICSTTGGLFGEFEPNGNIYAWY